jgi:hypothetical protein
MHTVVAAHQPGGWLVSCKLALCAFKASCYRLHQPSAIKALLLLMACVASISALEHWLFYNISESWPDMMMTACCAVPQLYADCQHQEQGQQVCAAHHQRTGAHTRLSAADDIAASNTSQIDITHNAIISWTAVTCDVSSYNALS